MNSDALKELQEKFRLRGLVKDKPKQEQKPELKEEIKGNKEGFANARKLLEAQMMGVKT